MGTMGVHHGGNKDQNQRQNYLMASHTGAHGLSHVRIQKFVEVNNVLGDPIHKEHNRLQSKSQSKSSTSA